MGVCEHPKIPEDTVQVQEEAINDIKIQRIKRNRISVNQFPTVNSNVEDKIQKLSKMKEERGDRQIWRVKTPLNIYYQNYNSQNKDDVPLGRCTIYKMKDNGDFQAYFQGIVDSNGHLEMSNSLFIFSNGSYYKGQSLDSGTYVNEITGLQYKGGWLNQMPHGKGEQHNNRGEYTGTYLNGEKDGQGKFIWKEGSYYEGSFKKDNFHGKGKLTDQHNEYFYEGNYAAGEKHGKGIETAKTYTYEGQFYCGQKSGFGKLKVNGISPYQYEGYFEDNLPDGPGKMFKNEITVQGVWEKGQLKAVI